MLKKIVGAALFLTIIGNQTNCSAPAPEPRTPQEFVTRYQNLENATADKVSIARQILGVTPESSISDIEKARRKISVKFHADKWRAKPEYAKAAEQAIKLINKAHDILKDLPPQQEIPFYTTPSYATKSQTAPWWDYEFQQEAEQYGEEEALRRHAEKEEQREKTWQEMDKKSYNQEWAEINQYFENLEREEELKKQKLKVQQARENIKKRRQKSSEQRESKKAKTVSFSDEESESSLPELETDYSEYESSDFSN